MRSPEFTCFGHRWRVRIYPGGHSTSEEGMVGICFDHLSNENIAIQYGFSVKDKNGKAKKEYTSGGAEEFAPKG